MGMASQIAEKEDNIITPDLRGSVFGNLEFSRRDLMALNIQVGDVINSFKSKLCAINTFIYTGIFQVAQTQ